MGSWLRCLKELNVLLPLPEFLITATKSFERNVLQVVTICVSFLFGSLRGKNLICRYIEYPGLSGKSVGAVLETYEGLYKA